jgi:CheY-like chemotaxis protein
MARVLLVDDDPRLGEMTAFRLQVDGHHVEIVHDAEEAVQTAVAGPAFDVAVLDVHMPGSGVELLNTFRANESTRGIPVVFYTAQAMSPALVHGLSLADPYLTTGQPLACVLDTIKSLSGRTSAP